MAVAVVNETKLQGDSRSVVLQVFKALGAPAPEILSVYPGWTDSRAVSKAMPQRKRLLRELREIGATKVLVCGGITRAVLRGETRSRAMADVHGRSEWLDIEGVPVYSIPTYSPYECLNKDHGEFAFRDFAFAADKLIRQDGPLPSIAELDLEFDLVETPSELREALEELADASFLGVDIETGGFAAGQVDITSMGYAARVGELGGYGIVVPHLVIEASKDLLREFHSDYSGTFVGHNFKFDLQHIQHADLVAGSFRHRDTMLLGHLLDERPVGSRFKVHGLKAQTRKRFDFPDYGLDMEKWLEANPGQPWRKSIHYGESPNGSQELYEYQFLDCYGTARLYEEQLSEVEEEDVAQLELHDTLQIPLQEALAEVEYGGIRCDRKYYRGAQKELEAAISKHEREVKKLAKDPNLNLGSGKQLNRVVYDEYGFDEVPNPKKPKTTRRSTDKDAIKVLMRQAEGNPAMESLIHHLGEYRRLAKIQSSFVDNLLKFSEADGRIHPDLNIPGTLTGRLSSWKPNLQNIPGTMAGGGIRYGFQADVGYKLIDADYSQLELRVAGMMSNDQDLLGAFRDGADIHMAVGQTLWGKDKLDKRERMLAKMVNFGIVYQRGVQSIAEGREMEYMLQETGEKWDVDEVQAFYDSYRVNYPQLFGWIDSQKEFAIQEGYVQTMTGRYRRFPIILRRNKSAVERQAVNAPIQGTAAELTEDALIRIHRRFKEEGLDAQVLLTVHDSILAQARTAIAKDAAEIVRYEMEDNLPSWIRPRAEETGTVFKADVELKSRWGARGGE